MYVTLLVESTHILTFGSKWFEMKPKIARTYGKLREQVSEKRAVELTLTRWQPTKP